MNLIPHTLQSWIELGTIICITHMLLMHTARTYGNRILFGVLASVGCIALIYAASLQMLIPFIPYVILLLVFRMLMPIATTSKNQKIHAAVPAIATDAQSWLTSCLKTVFNHPHATGIITILIGSKEALADGIHNNTPLNIPWSQALFMSLLYDPHIAQGMLWFSQTGSLLGMNTEWVAPKTDAEPLTQHKAPTKEYAAIICMIDQVYRTCTIIDHGIVQPPKNITETVQYITLRTTHTEHLKEGMYHGARHEQQNKHNHTP